MNRARLGPRIGILANRRARRAWHAWRDDRVNYLDGRSMNRLARLDQSRRQLEDGCELTPEMTKRVTAYVRWLDRRNRTSDVAEVVMIPSLQADDFWHPVVVETVPNSFADYLRDLDRRIADSLGVPRDMLAR